MQARSARHVVAAAVARPVIEAVEPIDPAQATAANVAIAQQMAMAKQQD